MFLLSKLRSSVTFRSLSQIFAFIQFRFKTQYSTPSYQTGILWVKKIGYYELNRPKEKSNDWIIIADESICIGKEKILLILGIRKSEIDFTKPLKIQDLKPLLVKSREIWTGDDIGHELRLLQEQLGTIIYGVTDSGGALKKGFSQAGIHQLFDITHSMANALEKIYKNDIEFNDFTHKMGLMRKKLCCSKFAHLIPPNQRSKSRFLNVDIIGDWGMKALYALEKENVSEDEKRNLIWVKKYRDLIEEMSSIISIVKEISILLKTYGLSKKSKSKCISYLKKCKKGKMKVFSDHIVSYLNKNISKIVKRREILLCCTDIIESTFGKFKNEISKNQMSGITDLALIIPALTSDLSVETINKAIDFCLVKEIKQWNITNLCLSLSVKRNKVFSKKVNENNKIKIVI